IEFLPDHLPAGTWFGRYVSEATDRRDDRLEFGPERDHHDRSDGLVAPGIKVPMRLAGVTGETPDRRRCISEHFPGVKLGGCKTKFSLAPSEPGFAYGFNLEFIHWRPFRPAGRFGEWLRDNEILGRTRLDPREPIPLQLPSAPGSRQMRADLDRCRGEATLIGYGKLNAGRFGFEHVPRIVLAEVHCYVGRFEQLRPALP